MAMLDFNSHTNASNLYKIFLAVANLFVIMFPFYFTFNCPNHCIPQSVTILPYLPHYYSHFTVHSNCFSRIVYIS